MDWYSFLLNEVFVGLVEMLFGFNVNIGGQISIGEMIIAVWFIFNFQKFSQIPNYRKYLVMYLCLIGAQIVSEVFVSSSFNNSLRGVLVSVFSLIHFTFLLYYFHKKSGTIVATLIGAALSIAVFGGIEDVDADSLMAGEAAAPLKMKIAPMMSYFIVAASIYLGKKYLAPMFLYLGLMVVALGARNAGLTLILTGVVGYLASTDKEIKRQYIYNGVFFLCIFCVFAYVFYVDCVLSGTITSGGNLAILQLKNPYNPFELLYYSRTEVFVAFQAFLDKFWFGHGSWAVDTDSHYRTIVASAHGRALMSHGTKYLPVHSVLIGWGALNGVFSFLAGGRLILVIIKEGFLALKKKGNSIATQYNPYAFCLAFCILSIAWNCVFSPGSHFRLSLPIYMAIIAFCYDTGRDND